MKATRPSASRRWSRAASRAWIAVTAKHAGEAIPASDAAVNDRQPPLPADVGAPDEVVEADAEHSGDQFKKAHPPFFGVAPHIGGQAARLAWRSAVRAGHI